MKIKHIGYVVNGYPHAHGGGGAGTYVYNIAHGLAKKGIQISVITDFCEQCPIESSEQGIDIYRYCLIVPNLHWYINKIPFVGRISTAIRYLEHGWALHALLRKINAVKPFDIVEFAEGGDFWSAIRRSFPYVAHLHGSRYTSLKMSRQPVDGFDWFHRLFELIFIRRADWIVSPSKAMLDVVQDEEKKTFKNASVIKLPILPNLLVDTASKPVDNCTRILFVGGEQYIKGGDILLKAIELLSEKNLPVEYILVGYENDPVLFAQLDTLTIKSFLPLNELQKEIASCDICVVSSRWENSPNIVYEALLAGKVVVASRVGGIPELVEDGETGILVPPEDSEALAQSILFLLENDEKRMCMGKKAQEKIKQLANLEQNVLQRLEIYMEVITNHGR